MRAFLALAGVAGVVLLVLATPATVIQIRIAGATDTASGIDTTISGADRHGPALVIIAVLGAMMLAGGLRGARAAMAALAAAGVAALGIAIIGDALNINDTGAIGQVYADARAGAGNGFYLETLGGALLLMSGGGLLLLSGGGAGAAAGPRASRRRPRRPVRDSAQEATSAPASPAPAKRDEDWFSTG